MRRVFVTLSGVASIVLAVVVMTAGTEPSPTASRH